MNSFAHNDKTTKRRTLLSVTHERKIRRKRSWNIKKLFSFIRIFKFNTVKRPVPRRLYRTKKQLALTVIGALVLIGGGSLFGLYEYNLQNSPQVIYARKVQSMTSQVSKYVSLPQDEQPVVATITNTAKLPHEKFFNDAKNGDKILMYKKHKKAILYRPSTGQVITEATLDFQNVQPTPRVQHTAVAGASTSATSVKSTSVPVTILGVTSGPTQAVTDNSYHPQGKILIAPQQQ
jgi:hypothetical protein